MPSRLLNLVRGRHSRRSKLLENDGIHSPTSSSTDSSEHMAVPTKSQRRRRGGMGKNGNSKIFRRMTSRRNLKNNSNKDGLIKDKHAVPQPSRTFSLSEDDASHVSSLLFSPVNNTMLISSNSSQQITMLSSPSRANPDFPPFFVSRQERLLQKYKLKLADVMESIEKKDAEIECLKQLAEDKKELHTVEMELKGIELEKKDLEIDNLKIEISKLKAEIDEQSKIIEALATSQHENVTCNWFSALPDLFLDLI